MQTVTVSRSIDAPPARVRAPLGEVGPFMQAAGFDTVDVDGDRIHVANTVGIATIELTLAVVTESGADLEYRQESGIFEEMRTTYSVEPADDGCEVTATTEFEVDFPLGGDVLDATVIKRQRRRELADQLRWLRNRAE